MGRSELTEKLSSPETMVGVLVSVTIVAAGSSSPLLVRIPHLTHCQNLHRLHRSPIMLHPQPSSHPRTFTAPPSHTQPRCHHKLAIVEPQPPRSQTNRHPRRSELLSRASSLHQPPRSLFANQKLPW